jgi:hypothetical protein
MSNLAESRNDIELEDVQFKAGVSASLMTKVGQTANFINRRHFERHQWNLNGTYSALVQNGIDGIFICPFDMEITAVGMSNYLAGTAGTTEIDIKWLSGTGVLVGTIFSTTPKISYTAGDNAYVFKNFADGFQETGTGLTLPVLSKSTFDQGDALRLDVIAAQTAATTLGAYIYFRPI